MSRTRVRVWDLPVRLFHWSVVALVAFQYVTAEAGWLDWHIAAGCTMLALLLFRIVWGFVGSETARFAHFLRGPRAAWQHLATFRGRAAEAAFGHSASGGWAVIAMLVLLTLQVGTGLFADDDIATQGPLGGFVSHATRMQLTGLHARLFWVLVAMIALHVAAILAYRFVKRTDLVGPMITGWTVGADGIAAPRMGRWWVAALVLVLCALVARKIWSLGVYI